MQLTFQPEFFDPDGRSLKLAFVLDGLASRKPYTDTGIALMGAAERHGHQVWAIDAATLGWRRPEAERPGGVYGEALRVHIRPDEYDWCRETGRDWLPLRHFDAVVLRRDPPFDLEYLNVTWLLERAEAEGVRVFNRPRAVRDHSEKLALAEFPQFTPSTVISRDLGQLQQFIDELRDVVLRPLDPVLGGQVFRVHRNDPNRAVILETLTERGRKSAVAQPYLPEIAEGDKRIVLIAGQPVPWCLARIPKAGETRSHLQAGGTGVARELSAHDRRIAEALGPILLRRGLLIVGLDVIGKHLTGLDVVNPALGLIEIRQQAGFDACGAFITAIEHACKLPAR